MTNSDQRNLDELPSQMYTWGDDELLRTYEACVSSFDDCVDETDFAYWTRAYNIVEEEVISRGLTY